MSAFHLTFNFCAFHFAKGHINSCPLDQSPIEQKVEKPEELLRCTGHSLDDIIATTHHLILNQWASGLWKLAPGRRCWASWACMAATATCRLCQVSLGGCQKRRCVCKGGINQELSVPGGRQIYTKVQRIQECRMPPDFCRVKLIQTGVFLSIFHQQKSTLSHQAASQSLCWRLMRLMVSIGRSSCLDWGMGAMELPGRTVEVCGDKISINIQMVLLWWHIMVMIYLAYGSIAGNDQFFYLMNIKHTQIPWILMGQSRGFHGFWLIPNSQLGVDVSRWHCVHNVIYNIPVVPTRGGAEVALGLCVYIYIYIYLSIYVCMYVIYLSIYLSIYVSMYLCIYVSMYVVLKDLFHL